MYNPEAELIKIMWSAGVDFTASLPCEKIKDLLVMVGKTFSHLPLTREEEGVGICAGAGLAGKRPAMFVQSSGIGNMINALLSLTSFYEMPLAIFVSQRGIYKEKIAAQLPMGQKLPGMLRGAGISHSLIASQDDFPLIERKLADVFRKNKVHVFLLSPAIWEGSEAGRSLKPEVGSQKKQTNICIQSRRLQRPSLTRYEVIQALAPFLEGAAVACNLGWPSKELHAVKHRPSQFYMLGSMGMVTPIGLGIALGSKKQVYVIDGDGSILMNPGTLATAAYAKPDNLTIIAIDNGVYGSTGNQPTLSSSSADLELLAQGAGITDTMKVSSERQIRSCLKHRTKGLRFLHVLALPGNRDVPNIPLHHLEIKKQVMDFLKS